MDRRIGPIGHRTVTASQAGTGFSRAGCRVGSAALFGLLVVLASPGLFAVKASAAEPWSVTLYGGPVTYTIFTQTLDGKARFNSGMVAVALDRRLAYLGWGWNLVGEAQYHQFFARDSRDFLEGSGNYSAVSLGLGVEYHRFPWERRLPTSLSVFLGPTYAFNPPLAYPRAAWGSRKSLENYLGIEIAVTIPEQRNLDAVFRLYHRSGVWGLYTNDVQEASVLGLGLRYRF